MTDTEAAFWRAAEQFGLAKQERNAQDMQRHLNEMLKQHFTHKQEHEHDKRERFEL